MSTERARSTRGFIRLAADWMPYALVAIDVALVLALGIHLLRGGAIVNNAIDIWFDRSDPTVQSLETEHRLFGSDTWMLATVWVKPGQLDDAGDVARRLTGDLERIDGVIRVVSPTSLEVLQRDEQGLFFDQLDEDTKWSELRERLLRHPFAGNLLVHPNAPASFSLLIKENTGPSTPGVVRQQLVSDVRRVLDTNPAVESSALAGTAVLNADLNRLSWRDFLVLIPLTVVVASLVLIGMLRLRWRTAIAVLTPIFLTTLALVSAMLLSGHPFTMVTLAVPGLCFTLGIASSLHVVGWIAGWPKEGRGTAADAANVAASHLLRPILVSAVTTALGFGLLAVVQVIPVQEMAIFGAAGELLSGLHVAFLLPRCLLWLGATNELTRDRELYAAERWSGERFGALAGRLARLQRVRYRVLVPLAAACLVIAWLVSMVTYDSTYIDMINPNERLRQDYARFEAAGLPSAQLSVVVRSGANGDSVDAALNTALVTAAAEIEALPEVSKVVGPASVFAEVAPALAETNGVETVADSDASVTDAYIFALSGGNTEIGSYVHDGLGAYRMVVFFPYLDNTRLQRLTDGEITGILRKHFGAMAQVSTEISGVTVLWAHMDSAVSRGQVTSVLVMALACFAIFFISLRSWTLAAIATFVNVMPVAVVGALLGALGRPIDMATVFIMGISLGVAVDDTSFFIHGFLERRGAAARALAETLRHNGPTMIATCVVIVIGFSVLLASSFMPMRTFGGLTALGLVLAVLCDVFIAPFLLLSFYGKTKDVRHAEDTDTGAVVHVGAAGAGYSAS
jgi:predicted RND superfamily exporter protein